MFRIVQKAALEQLRLMAVHLNADFSEGRNAAMLTLDNAHGQGRIFTYEMMHGLSLRAYNISFAQDFYLRTGGGSRAPIYMLYCLEGHWFHKFSSQEESIRIGRGQNVILSSAEDEINLVVFPKQTRIRLSVIIIERTELGPHRKYRPGLKAILNDLYSKVEAGGPFRHFGGINPNIDEYARILTDNDRTDVVGRLILEAAILNTMAAQLDTHERHINDQLEKSPLTEDELERILTEVEKMQDQIDKPHTIDRFTKRVGLSPKKLQEGFQFIFGESFAGFVKNLRLELARELLETTDMRISEVAADIGISSKSHFSKMFKEKYALLPSQYKEYLRTASRPFELSYRSASTLGVGEADVKEIVEQANDKNQSLGVSGCLVYYRNNFFQILEGPRKEVLEIFDAICNDSRHKDVEVLWKGSRDDRVFAQNGMVLLSDQSISSKLSTGRQLSIDMKTLVQDRDNTGVSSRLFWERIRNRILTSNMN